MKPASAIALYSLVHGVRQGEHEVLLRVVVLVAHPVLNGARRNHGKTGFRVLLAFRGLLKVGDVRLNDLPAGVGQGPIHKVQATAVGPLPPGGVVLVELLTIPGAGVHLQNGLARLHVALLNAAQPRRDVVGEAALGLLSVINVIDAQFRLFAHLLFNRRGQTLSKQVLVVGPPGLPVTDHLLHVSRFGQSARMVDKDPVVASLHVPSSFMPPIAPKQMRGGAFCRVSREPMQCIPVAAIYPPPRSYSGIHRGNPGDPQVAGLHRSDSADSSSDEVAHAQSLRFGDGIGRNALTGMEHSWRNIPVIREE